VIPSAVVIVGLTDPRLLVMPITPTRAIITAATPSAARIFLLCMCRNPHFQFGLKLKCGTFIATVAVLQEAR
jgi:hypothetical protein